MLSQIMFVVELDADKAKEADSFFRSWANRVSPGIKTEAAISETDPPAEEKTDHVLIKSAEGYYRERDDGATPDVSEAHRFERSEAQRIVAEDRAWTPDVRIEEIPAAPKAAEPTRSPDDFVLIQTVSSGDYWRGFGRGTTSDIAEAHRYSRRDAERFVGDWEVVRIVEIAPAVTDPWQERYNRVCERNLRLHGRIAELERLNADLLEDANSLIKAFVRNLAA